MAESFWKIEPIFPFESMFDDSWIDWCRAVWYTTFIASTIYVILIYPAKRWMEPRDPFKVRTPLIVWNLFIGVFSIVGTVRCLPVLINAIRYDGFYATVCGTQYFSKGYIGIWGLLFVLSKFPELVDTAFIILRKQKLIFLHWYHHASTLIFAWRMYSTRSSVAFWFCVMNYCVHSLMYSYYAARAAGFRINRKVAMCVTTLQLSQMFMGMFAILYAVYHKVYREGCSTETPELVFGIVVYTSYMVLFAHFFYNTYIRNARARKSFDVADSRKVTNGVNGTHATPTTTTTSTIPQLTNGMRRREKEGVAS